MKRGAILEYIFPEPGEILIQKAGRIKKGCFIINETAFKKD